MTKTKQEKKSKEQHTWMSWMTTKEKGPKLEAKQKKRRGENASPVFLESHPWKISDEPPKRRSMSTIYDWGNIASGAAMMTLEKNSNN